MISHTMHVEGDATRVYTDAYINRVDGPDDNLHRSMRRIRESFRGLEHKFDVVVVSGLSGTIPGAIYAHENNKQLVVIRKDDDICHGVRTEGREYFHHKQPYVIIDDFISCGTTMRRIYEKLAEFGHEEMPRYTVLYRGTRHKPVQLPDQMGHAFLGKWFIQGKRTNNRECLYIPYLTTYEDGDEPKDWALYVRSFEGGTSDDATTESCGASGTHG